MGFSRAGRAESNDVVNGSNTQGGADMVTAVSPDSTPQIGVLGDHDVVGEDNVASRVFVMMTRGR